MLTERFEPIDAEGLSQKAESLTSQNDDLVVSWIATVFATDAVSAVYAGGRCCSDGDDQSDAATSWTSRLGQALPMLKVLENFQK